MLSKYQALNCTRGI